MRSDFLQYLVKSLPPGVLHLDHDVSQIVALPLPEQDMGHSNHGSRAEVTFVNGKTYTGSLVVGCDGSKSKVRSLLFGEDEHADLDPFYVDMNVWWCITPIAAISEEDRVSMNAHKFNWASGPHRLYFEGGAIMHLIAKDQVILVVDYRAPSLLQDHKNWAGNASSADLMKFMETWRIPEKYWPVAKHALRVSHFGIPKGLSEQLGVWSKDRTVLLGDAVHPTPHFFGQGANAAIQDAYCLTRCLCIGEELEEAFRSYVAVRKRPADDIIAKSYLLGMTETAGGISRVVRDLVFFTVLKTGLFTWPSVDIMTVRV